MEKIEINVEGMMCSNCEKHVAEALSKVPGVKSASADREKKAAFVEAEDGVGDDLLKAAVEEAGYKPGDVARAKEKSRCFFSRLFKR